MDKPDFAQLLTNNLADFFEFIKSSKEFIVSQAPPTVTEFLNYFRIYCISHFVIYGVIVSILFFFAKKFDTIYKLEISKDEYNQNNDTRDFANVSRYVLVVAAIIFSSLAVTTDIVPLIQSYINPHIIILKEFHTVLGG